MPYINRYKYYDPPERSQGSSISVNGTFKGTLGLIWKRVSVPKDEIDQFYD